MSEGAYFRFQISNNNSFPITVTVNGADTYSVPSRKLDRLRCHCAQISVPYEQVTYNFSMGANLFLARTVELKVLVLNSSFVQIFNLIVPILIVIAFVIIATVAIVILRRYMHRRRSNLKSAQQQRTN